MSYQFLKCEQSLEWHHAVANCEVNWPKEGI